MDGFKRSVGLPLALRREFIGSRLEEQVLRRAYELAAPVLCQPMRSVCPRSTLAWTAKPDGCKSRPQALAKGA